MKKYNADVTINLNKIMEYSERDILRFQHLDEEDFISLVKGVVEYGIIKALDSVNDLPCLGDYDSGYINLEDLEFLQDLSNIEVNAKITEIKGE